MGSETAETAEGGARAADLGFDGLVVDLDGVVWLRATAMPKSVDTIGRLRARGVQLVLLTNDPRGSRADRRQ
jgi:ribonucleotide monophosphatase NagD (HAD superfamily)